MRAAAKLHTFNTSRWRLYAPDFGFEDPTYRNPWVNATQVTRRRKAAGFDVSTSYGGVVLVREDPRETSYAYDAAPAEQTDTVRRMEANRAYREWTAKHGYVWKDAMLIYDAYDAAATLIVLRKLGYEPEWTHEQQIEFEHWCREHDGPLQQVLEMIE